MGSPPGSLKGSASKVSLETWASLWEFVCTATLLPLLEFAVAEGSAKSAILTSLTSGVRRKLAQGQFLSIKCLAPKTLQTL